MYDAEKTPPKLYKQGTTTLVGTKMLLDFSLQHLMESSQKTLSQLTQYMVCLNIRLILHERPQINKELVNIDLLVIDEVSVVPINLKIFWHIMNTQHSNCTLDQ